MKKYKKITECIGNTPLVDIPLINKSLHARILVKLESFNPCSSIKDRIALAMIEGAEKAERIKPGDKLIEPSSGNTGIGLAFVAAAKGYKLCVTMPANMSVERQTIMKALGAEIVLTNPDKGMKGAIEAAQNLARERGAYLLKQFENPDNPLIHENTTGPEIWDASEGKIDIFVAGVGTGGTITGVARALKKQNPNIRIIAVEPSGSPVLSAGTPGKHKIQGIGAGFIPKVLDRSLIDMVSIIDDSDAAFYARELARKEGILVGISSGAALKCAVDLARDENNKGKLIVALLPDSGERYLSTWLYEDL